MDLDPEDAVGNEEIVGTTNNNTTAQLSAPGLAGGGGGGRGESTKETESCNAFDYLMAPKAQKPQPLFKGPFTGKDELGAYTAHKDPLSQWPGVVLHADAAFVSIYDKFPKSTVHTLLLPRAQPLSRLHPFDAFDGDPAFLAAVRAAAAELKRRAAAELRRSYGRFSAQDRLREAVLDGAVEWDAPSLPAGRDWEKELLVGVHAKPSMNDLHVHVMSRDMMGHRMLKPKHYLTFNTPFLVDLADFPLPADDPRRDSSHRRKYLRRDLVCWRCEENFGKDFAALKKHLEVEFEAWKKE
ncbi:HIT domain-containing protein [Xylariaceae sp. FL0594]|nr:HIT domain-containing protein [Xylariaceae sp. FL0594]